MTRCRPKTAIGYRRVRPAKNCCDGAGRYFAVALDPTLGHEQQGHRPVLVVSASAFDRVTRVPIVVPITNVGGFARTAGFTVTLMGSGLRTTGVVRCDQPRTVDLTARGAKRIESVPNDLIEEVFANLVALFE